jgi:hypothetical protein
MSSHSKFVMATIHVPVEITVEGTQITHTELYEVEFSAIDRLPVYREPPAFVDVAGLFSKISEEPGIAFRNDEPDSGSESDESESGSESESESGSDDVEFRFQSTFDNGEEDEEDPSLTVAKTEIRGPRPYPKSRTFRHNGASKRRYTRKSDSRFIHIPQSVINEL